VLVGGVEVDQVNGPRGGVGTVHGVRVLSE
jgi:hypothetical protein